MKTENIYKNIVNNKIEDKYNSYIVIDFESNGGNSRFVVGLYSEIWEARNTFEDEDLEGEWFDRFEDAFKYAEKLEDIFKKRYL